MTVLLVIAGFSLILVNDNFLALPSFTTEASTVALAASAPTFNPLSDTAKT